MRSLITTIFLFFSLNYSILSQVVTSIPQFPTVNDSIIFLFHSDEGDRGLMGYTGDVYVHTGISTANADWQYVIGAWGQTNQPKLENIGTDLWQLTIGDIYEFYGAPRSETITAISFVFRSPQGEPSGRDVGGADIFYDLFEPGLSLSLASPQLYEDFGDPDRAPVFVGIEDTVHFKAYGVAIGTQVAEMSIEIDGNIIEQTTADSILFDFIAADYARVLHRVKIVTSDTTNKADSLTVAILIKPESVTASIPGDVIDGINLRSTSVVLSLFAPYKDFVYVIGDFNDWKISDAYIMKRNPTSPDQARFWLEIENLDPDTEYAFQYYVDGEIRVADPYTEKVLDPENDKFISAATYSNLKPYPHNKTKNIVSTFTINKEEYVWQTTDFTMPEKTDLVIYELMMRDFIAKHDFATLIDTLDYLQNLGVNAIELMPVSEFEKYGDGEWGWGYNPSFYFAVEKYFGPAEDLKQLIDAAHGRGMAVILDLVLNHSYDQSPLVQLYINEMYLNPWHNQTSPHTDFYWGRDFDHESLATQNFIDRVNAFWINEFKFDGFRFDFTRGFTNKSGSSGPYDASRIAILKRMADQIWQENSAAILILEHLVDDNNEIKELADYGMLMWGNANHNYNEATMGYNTDGKSDFSWTSYKNLGYQYPHLVSYMESHDEERLMYKNLRWGNSSGTYTTKDLNTALDRMKLAAAFFFTIPGPKMLWQFGELGYDYSKFYDPKTNSVPEPYGTDYAKLDPKPIRWDYFQNEWRRDVYNVWAALAKLKQHNAFRSTDFTISANSALKRIKINHSSMDVFVIGNFDVREMQAAAGFQHTGIWYDFFTGDSVNVLDTAMNMTLTPGEFHLYTTVLQPVPETKLATSITEETVAINLDFQLLQNYPNPFNPETMIPFSIREKSEVTLKVFDLLGREVRTLANASFTPGNYEIKWDGRDNAGLQVAGGVYFVRILAGKFTAVRKTVLLR
ncbi:MAG: T9SS C-terminal target domain-containing protein [Calditrichaeota bacterium]|nr:MAG: T9SS C-terminal target domain-containing protein [Calditrichota bacterium]